MSTRSNIIIKDREGNAVQLYNHYDSYPSGLGKDLRRVFRNKNKCKKWFDTVEECADWLCERIKVVRKEDELGLHADIEYLYVVDISEGILSCRRVCAWRGLVVKEVCFCKGWSGSDLDGEDDWVCDFMDYDVKYGLLHQNFPWIEKDVLKEIIQGMEDVECDDVVDEYRRRVDVSVGLCEEFLDTHGLGYSHCRENGIDTYGIETGDWTDMGVQMPIFIDGRSANMTEPDWWVAEFDDAYERFDVDEEIELHRQDEQYKSAFTIRRSLEDFEKFEQFLKELAEDAAKFMKAKSA